MINKLELIAMLEAEQKKNNAKYEFLQGLTEYKTIAELKAYFKANNIKFTHSTKMKHIDIYNGNFYTIYTSDTLEDNYKRLLEFPAKYKKQIEFLLDADNMNIAINDYLNYNNIQHTAYEAKENSPRFNGCYVNKFLSGQSDKLESKYYYFFHRSILNMISWSDDYIIINDILNVLNKVIKLQNNMWMGKLSHENNKDIEAINIIEIEKLLEDVK